jgi:hypothetical protein
MSDQVDSTRLRLMAIQYLLYAVVTRWMLLDPGFAQDARGLFDYVSGIWSASEHAGEFSPEVVTTLREECIRLLEFAENLGPLPITSTVASDI